MNVSLRRVEILTTCLIALSAIELSNHIIDMMGIPLPRLIFGMSWFTGMAAIAIFMLLPIRPGSLGAILGWTDVAYLSTIAGWLIAEALRDELDRTVTLSGIFAWIGPWVISIAARLHLRIFDNRQILVQSFVVIATALAFVHLCLLLPVRVGLRMPLIVPSEIVDRNSISMFLVVALFLWATWSRDKTAQPSWSFVGLIVFAFVHAELNNARAATLVLVLVVTLQLVRVVIPDVRQFRRICQFLCAAIIVAVIGVSLAQWTRSQAAFGGGDATTSASQRGETNVMLVNLFLSHPWAGVGWHRVLYARSGGHVGHTLYVNIPAAFGVLGLAPVLMIGLWRVMRQQTKGWTSELSMTLVLVTAVATFVNDPVAWYGLVFALLVNLEGTPSVGIARTRSDVTMRVRPNYATAMVIALGTLVILGGWVRQRAPYVATAEVHIARTGAYVLTAIESSRESAEFVEVNIFLRAPGLRDRCSLSPAVDRQILTIICTGGSEEESRLAVERIVQPLLERHRELFAEKRQLTWNTLAVDRSIISNLIEWARAIESERAQTGLNADSELLAFLNLQRGILMKRLGLRHRTQALEHTSRLEHGIRVRQRQPPWLMVLSLTAMIGIVSAAALGVGEAARSMLEAPLH